MNKSILIIVMRSMVSTRPDVCDSASAFTVLPFLALCCRHDTVDLWSIRIAENIGVLNKNAVLLKGEPRNAAENFDTYRIVQRHCAVSLPKHSFLVGLCLHIADNAGFLSKVS